MVGVLGVIGARLNSSRLPGKQLLDLAGKPMIARIFERLEQTGEFDHLVLATTNDLYNAPLVEWAERSGKAVFAFRGDVNDLVGRVDAVVNQFSPDIVVYICGDSPLIEPVILSRLIRALRASPQSDLAELTIPRSGAITIHEGFNPYPIKTWRRLVELATERHEREHVGVSLKKIDGLMRVYAPDDEIYSRIDHRISVDTPSDYQFISEVYRRWYEHNPPQSIVSLGWVIEQLQSDEALRRINQQVRQKGVLDRSAKILLVSQCGKSVGLGHLRRTMAMARAFQDRCSASVKLLIAGDRVDLPALGLLPHLFIAEEELIDRVIEQVMVDKIEAVVLDMAADRMKCDAGRLFSEVAGRRVLAVAVDGFFEHQELLDLIYVPSFFLVPEQMGLAEKGKVVYGWDHYFIDQSLQPDVWSAGNRVIVMSGGSDHYGLGAVWPDLLDRELPTGTEITWIQGPYAKEPRLPAKPRLKWFVEKAPDNLAQLMAQANYALTPYGVTLFEFLKLAKPVVTYHPLTSQQAEVAAFKETDVVRIAHSHDRAVAELKELMSDEESARHLSARAAEKMRGSDGATNLASRVMALIESHK